MRAIFLIPLVLGIGSNVLAQNQIAVNLTTDQYGSETIWQIDGTNVSYNHIQGGYEDQPTPGSYPQPTVLLDLPDGNFYFCLGDVFDDGFCCAFGQGSLTVTHVLSGTVLFHTDTFSTGTVCTQFSLPFSRVQGTLFLDEDHSCDAGPSEPRVPSQVLRVLPGPIYGLTDANGDYDIRVPYGDFNIDVVYNGLVPICPTSEPVPFSTSAASPLAQVLLGDSSVAKLDIVAAALIGAARPGFSVTHTIQFTNASTYPSGPLTATVQLDPLISFASASITPTSVVGGTLTWSLPALGDYEQHTILVHGQLPADPLLLGQEISITASAFQPLDETVLWNNTYTAHQIITGSFDPNDKLVWPRELYDLAVDSVLDYSIRFQNTGTDTAFTVVITDTLAAELDMSTFQAGASTHPCAISFKPGRVVEWRFANIMLPDSNVNEPASHGQVGFRIRPLQPLLPGTEIGNKADIHFDFNPPVRTNDAVVVAEFNTGLDAHSVGGPRLSPNPATEVLNVIMPEGTSSVDVLTIDGRSVELPTARRADGYQLDVSVLPAGLYIVQTLNGSARFVKH